MASRERAQSVRTVFPKTAAQYCTGNIRKSTHKHSQNIRKASASIQTHSKSMRNAFSSAPKVFATHSDILESTHKSCANISKVCTRVSIVRTPLLQSISRLGSLHALTPQPLHIHIENTRSHSPTSRHKTSRKMPKRGSILAK